MRLISTHTLEFEEFEGQNIPPYAILSHRWEEQEVSFKDVKRGTAVTKKGWQKITKCCEQARQDGLSYAWVDTCCIDKRSSAELSEAINSMFRWYQHSKTCYVYLHDVHVSNLVWKEWKSSDYGFSKWSKLTEWKRKTLTSRELPMLSKDFVAEFCNSVWFTRGWTLQELLASENMKFFGCYWQRLGSKNFLCTAISDRTCIPVSVLIHEKPMGIFTIAERMSWAARRDTTRIEDRAYSLMGIFGVNMPTLYGEGEAAFIRLQEEIVKRSNDQSILLWSSDELGVLAKSPAAFEIHLSEPADMLTRSLHPFDQPVVNEEIYCFRDRDDEVISVTQIGLSITLYLVPWYFEIYLVPLNIKRVIKSSGDISSQSAYIFLKQDLAGLRFYRVRFRGEAFTYIPKNSGYHFRPQLMDIRGDKGRGRDYRRECIIAPGDLTPMGRIQLLNHDFYGIYFSFELHKCWGPDGILRAGDVIARQRWSPAEQKIELEAGVWGVVAVFRVIRPSGEPSFMYVGFDRYFTPCFVQKEWDHDVCFDDIVEARPGPVELSQVLDAWKFDDSVRHGSNEAQLVIQGRRYLHSSVLKDTAISGIRLRISRQERGYSFDFRNDA